MAVFAQLNLQNSRELLCHLRRLLALRFLLPLLISHLQAGENPHSWALLPAWVPQVYFSPSPLKSASLPPSHLCKKWGIGEEWWEHLKLKKNFLHTCYINKTETGVPVKQWLKTRFCCSSFNSFTPSSWFFISVYSALRKQWECCQCCFFILLKHLTVHSTSLK